MIEMTASDEENSGIDGIEVVAMVENKSYGTFEVVMQCIILIASIIIFYTYAFGVIIFYHDHNRPTISATDVKPT